MSSPHPNLTFPIRHLLDGLLVSAHWIWNRRGIAKRTGFPFSEETITETVLLDLASALSHTIQIMPFNKTEEGQIGADWEWCLHDQPNSRYLRFLVQAKVLDNKDQLYAHIDRKIGKTSVRQIDRLRETAGRRGVSALYAFYNNLSAPNRVPVGVCSCFNCLKCWGASVAPLHAVLALLPDKSFDSLKEVSFPWVCLVCPEQDDLPTDRDVIDDALVGLRRLDELARDRLGERMSDAPAPRDSPEQVPPDYFGTVREMAFGASIGPSGGAAPRQGPRRGISAEFFLSDSRSCRRSRKVVRFRTGFRADPAYVHLQESNTELGPHAPLPPANGARQREKDHVQRSQPDFLREHRGDDRPCAGRPGGLGRPDGGLRPRLTRSSRPAVSARAGGASLFFVNPFPKIISYTK